MSPALLPDDERPDLETGVEVDGDEVAVWRVGNQQAKAHRPHPVAAEFGYAVPSCWFGTRRIYGTDADYKFERVDVTEGWREPCSECWPDHYADAGQPNDQTLSPEDDGKIDARRLRYQSLGDD